jgi:hypothetical protein
MKISLTFPGVKQGDIKKNGGYLFAVVIIDAKGHATSADGFVTEADLQLEANEFVKRIGEPAVSALVEMVRPALVVQ